MFNNDYRLKHEPEQPHILREVPGPHTRGQLLPGRKRARRGRCHGAAGYYYYYYYYFIIIIIIIMNMCINITSITIL